MKRFNWKKILPVLLLLFIAIITNAQEAPGKQSIDFMRSNGRIYVVIAVMLTILAGLILYLVRLEKKISRLEKDI